MRNKAKRGQDGISGRRRAREGQWRRTNPICPAGPDGLPRPTSRLCKTNPIPGHAGGTKPGAGGPGASVRNKANFPAGPGGMGSEARRTRGKCAKRTQSQKGSQVPSFKCEAGEPCPSPPGLPTSNVTLYTPNWAVCANVCRPRPRIGVQSAGG
jgi:hypothetical protein